MKKFIQIGAVFLVLIIGFFAYQYLLPNIRPPRGFLKVVTNPAAEVTLTGEDLGNTPLQKSELRIGKYTLTIKGQIPTRPVSPDQDPESKNIEINQDIELESSAVTSVKYDLASDERFTSGEILGLRKGAGISIVTKPDNSEIFIDGESLGPAPLSQIIDPGVHTLKVSKDGYISREIGINVQEGFRLTANVTLALNPYPQTKKLAERGKFTIYDLSTDSSSINNNFATWADALWHFQNSGSKIPRKLDLLVDESGETYFLVDKYSDKKSVTVGYLSKNPGKLSEKAKASWNDLVGGKAKGEISQKVTILDTPNGFLNVRSAPGTENSILTKIKPGQSFELTKEKGDWFKIIYTDSKQGWISSQFAEKN